MAEHTIPPTRGQAAIWDYIEAHPDSTAQEIAIGMGKNPATVSTCLSHLTAMGYVSHAPRVKGRRQYRVVRFWEEPDAD